MPAIVAIKARRSLKSANAVCRGSKAVTQLAYFPIAALVFASLTTAHAGERGSPNPLWGVPLADLRVTVERPLFSPLRRPPPPPPAAPPVIAVALPPPRPADPERPRLALLGTIIGEGNEIAVLLDESTKDIVHLKVGQDRRGWTLKSVHGRQVDLEKDHRIASLAFKRDTDEQRPAEPHPAEPHPAEPHPAEPQVEKPQADIASLTNPDMEAYRAELRQRRGR